MARCRPCRCFLRVRGGFSRSGGNNKYAWLWSAAFLLASIVGVDGSIYNVYNYDQTAPLFTPDGRLLQVEYAGLASQHSSPLVMVPFCLESHDTHDDDKDKDGYNDKKKKKKKMAILVATTTTTTPTSRTRHTNKDKNEDEGVDGSNDKRNNRRHDYKRTTTGQRRIVEIPVGEPASRSSGGGGSILVGLSGILADNVALLRQVISPSLESFQRDYGVGSGSTVQLCQRLAVAVGDACESYSLGGGIRPFGATLLFCAVNDDDDNNDNDDNQALVCVTNPSGAVSTYSLRPYDTEADSILVVGGEKPTVVQERVRTELQATPPSSSLSPNTMVRRVVRAVAKVLLQGEKTISTNDEPWEDDLLQSLEMVILTGSTGAHRLSVQHLHRLLDTTRQSDT